MQTMFLRTGRLAAGNHSIILVGPGNVKVRLNGTCFRQQGKALGGNFLNFKSLEEIFQIQGIVDALVGKVRDAFDGDGRLVEETSSVCLTLYEPVGWESTAPRVNYSDSDLEQFEPNNRSQALRIRKDRLDIKAPLTNRLTIIYTLSLRHDELRVVIRSVYPGQDIGKLVGNVTHRERCVFFDWNHPGEELPALTPTVPV